MKDKIIRNSNQRIYFSDSNILHRVLWNLKQIALPGAYLLGSDAEVDDGGTENHFALSAHMVCCISNILTDCFARQIAKTS